MTLQKDSNFISLHIQRNFWELALLLTLVACLVLCLCLPCLYEPLVLSFNDRATWPFFILEHLLLAHFILRFRHLALSLVLACLSLSTFLYLSTLLATTCVTTSETSRHRGYLNTVRITHSLALQASALRGDEERSLLLRGEGERDFLCEGDLRSGEPLPLGLLLR